MPEIICSNCKRKTESHSRNMCNTCYKKLIWKPKLVKCKRCERELPMHAKGLCDGCYNSVFHIEAVKDFNRMKYHNVEPELYRKVTKICIICGFDKVIQLHHIDHNHQNNSESNLIGLCPNHHKMAHHRTHQKEVFQVLQKKGFKVPETYLEDHFFKEPVELSEV